MIPNVTVIVPNYNHSIFLQQRINSVLNQTYQDFEIIILDDFSTDNSKDIIEEYRDHPKVAHISYNEINSGSTFKQWAKGLAIAKGKYVWIAESDDRCEENFLEDLLNLHHNFENVGIAYCKSLPVNLEDQVYDYTDSWMKQVDPNKWDASYFNYGVDECERYLSVQCTIPNASAILFKRAVFNDIDFTRINFKICGDWFIYVKILKFYNIAYTANPLNYHRNHQNNARTKHFNILLEEQSRVLCYINRNFKIKKTKLFYKSLDKLVDSFMSKVKSREISLSNSLTILKNMFSVDHWIFFRIGRVFFLKVFKYDTRFK